MNKAIIAILALLFLGGCAVNPWPPYETALRCHLDGKKETCDQYYRKAILAGPKTQGLHASYGTHLLLENKQAEAMKEFGIEESNYPNYAPKAISRLALGADNPTKPSLDSTTLDGSSSR